MGMAKFSSARRIAGDCEHQDVCTGFEGLLERVGVEPAQIGLERLRVLHVDGEAGRYERVERIECYESYSHGERRWRGMSDSQLNGAEGDSVNRADTPTESLTLVNLLNLVTYLVLSMSAVDDVQVS